MSNVFRMHILLLTVPLCSAASLEAAQPTDKTRAYHVHCRYQLTNKTDAELKNVRVHIPVPQDCPYQKIQTFEITLKSAYETTEVVDQYGQQICRITLPRIGPRESAEVGFTCDVIIRPDHRIPLDRKHVGTLDDVPKEIHEQYTTNLKYVYDLESPEIQKTAAKLAKPHRNLLDRVMAFHDFVALMTYKRDGRWDPASTVLRRKNGSCSEFSYLFCALCRAVKIPTRFAGGTCFRRKMGASWPVIDKVYHRWAEVYLPPYGWVPFDVTRDRGVLPKRTYVGAGPKNALILSRGGAGSRYLSNQYIGSNTQPLSLGQIRTFAWSPRQPLPSGGR